MSAPNGSRGGASAPEQPAAATLATVAQALLDAAQLTARYGSTVAARERLDMLEREQEGLNDMIAMLRTRLRQSQRATTSAEAEARRHKAALISAQSVASTSGSPSGSSGSGESGAVAKSLAHFDADAFVHFLKRKFACRGDMALLLDALFEYQMQQSDAFQQNQTNERVVLLTIEEVQTSLPSPSPNNASSTRSDMSYGLHVKTSASSTPTGGRSSTPSSSSGNPNGDRKYGAMGIGVHNPYSKRNAYYSQSLEEEEQEIHLAAKQLLSPVTFTHVEDDQQDDGLKQQMGTLENRGFVSIHHSDIEPKSSFMRAQTPDEARQQLAKILPKKPKVKKTARVPSPLQHVGPYVQSAAQALDGDEPTPKKRKTGLVEESLVIKQNLVWPAERRNITEMKHSSRFLDLSVLEALDKQTPWNEMYKRRPLYSHVVNYSELDDRAKTWFATTLKIQFVWRRELWERLHWLPMSESVCTGTAWEKYRQTRKRRAKHAVTAWRKVYAQSIQMIEAGILPDDIWCDPALWYMPANPIYWLPESHDVITELAAIDERHKVRCYHVYDLSRHPFYALGLVDKYPDKHELPSFSAVSMQHPGVAEEDLANFGVRAAHGPQHHPKVIITKDASGGAAGAIRQQQQQPQAQQQLQTQSQQPQPQSQLSTVVVPQKLKTPVAATVTTTTEPEAAPADADSTGEDDEMGTEAVNPPPTEENASTESS